MAKMNEDKAAMYLVAIVGVVAAVGILVLLMNAGIGSSSDYSGQVVKASSTKITSSKIATVTSTKEIKTNFKLAPIGNYQCYFIRGETYCFDDRECPTSMEIKAGSITYVCEVECDNDKPDSSGTCECDYKLDKNGQKMCVSV